MCVYCVYLLCICKYTHTCIYIIIKNKLLYILNICIYDIIYMNINIDTLIHVNIFKIYVCIYIYIYIYIYCKYTQYTHIYYVNKK